MPITYGVFVCGYLAIIGFPLATGFWTKDKIIESALDKGGTSGWILGIVALLGAGLTAFYMTRALVMTFHGERRWEDDVHPHESPRIMTWPMIALAALALVGGYLLIFGAGVQHWLTPSVGPSGRGGRAHRVSRRAHASSPCSSSRSAPPARGSPSAGGRSRSTQPVGVSPDHDCRAPASSTAEAFNEAVLERPGLWLDAGPGLLRQQGSRRCGQRRRRRIRRRLRPIAPDADRIRAQLRAVDDGRRGRRHRGPARGEVRLMHNFALVGLVLVPLVGSLVVFALPKHDAKLAKQVTLFVLPGDPRLHDRPRRAIRHRRAPAVPVRRAAGSGSRSLGVHLAFGVDGIALVLVVMSAVLVPAVILASWNSFDGRREAEEIGTPKRSVRAYFGLLLLLEFFMVGVFTATDVFLFYVFFEAMLVPMYFIIGSFGGPRRQYAAMKFFLYSLVGGLLMLAAVIGLYVTAGKGTFSFSDLIGSIPDNATQKWLFLGFFIAFAIKAPLVPFHTWLPDAGAEAPAGGAALLVGVLDKVGTFGFLRYCLPLFPDASRYFAPTILILSVIGILYAAFLAIGQRDMKRLVAYTSVAHFGFIGLGIFAFTTQGGTGAVLYMVNHGFSTGVLFLVVGLLIARGKSRNVADYGGTAKVTPMLAGAVPAGRALGAGAARHEHVRQRVPRAGRHVHAAQGAGDARHRRHHPRRALRAVALPAHHAGRGHRQGHGSSATSTCARHSRSAR